jgi:hypothetical protein
VVAFSESLSSEGHSFREGQTPSRSSETEGMLLRLQKVTDSAKRGLFLLIRNVLSNFTLEPKIGDNYHMLKRPCS